MTSPQAIWFYCFSLLQTHDGYFWCEVWVLRVGAWCILCFSAANALIKESLMAYKASLTSRHIGKMSFLTLPWRREEVAAGLQLYSLASVRGIFVFILNCCLCCKFSGRVFSPHIRILGFRRAPLVVGRFVNLRTEIKPVATEQLLGTFMTVGKWVPWTVLPRKGKMLNGKKGLWEPDTATEQLTMMQEALSVPGEILDNPVWRGRRTWFSSSSFPSVTALCSLMLLLQMGFLFFE